jgi:AcrR family transcriptional regulator
MVRELSGDKRERLLQAALRLFAANGIQNTSTAEIAAKAKVASGTLFLYFPTKQHLVNELVILVSKQEAEHINTLLNPSMSVRDTFFTIWDGSIRWLLEHPEVFQYSQQVRHSGLVSQAATLESGKYFSFYYETIQRGLQEGSIKPYPIDLIGGFLYQDIVAVMNHIRMQPDQNAITETIQKGFDLFWDGIKM